MTNLQAAVGIAQLRKLEARAEHQRCLYRWYVTGLAGIRQIRLFHVDIDGGAVPQWIDAVAEDRDQLVAYLERVGMECRPFWFPIHSQKPYRRPDAEFPVSSRLLPHAVWLPSALQVDEADSRLVCEEIGRFYTSRT